LDDYYETKGLVSLRFLVWCFCCSLIICYVNLEPYDTQHHDHHMFVFV
jgi:hypothetical protein